MCMDEFVKRLYDFMGIYKKFWSQNSDYRYLPIFTDILPIFTDILPIFTDIYRYFIDIYRYFTDILPIFTDILPIFFQKFLHKRACSTVAIFPLIDFSFDFSSQYRPKTDFSTKYRPKKPIFCSL